MPTLLRTLPVLALLLIATGVAHSATTFAQETATIDMAIDRVDDISISGTGEATITIGSPATLHISGPQAALDQLDVLVDDDELEIEPKPGANIQLGAGESLRYDITIPSLEDLRLRGAVSLEASGISGDDLDIALEGATTATLSDVSVGDLEIDLRGASLLVISGTASELEADLREATTLDAINLIVEDADIRTRDAATATIHVTRNLEADAAAASRIFYAGNPPSTDISTRDAAVVEPASSDPAATASPSASPVASAPERVSLEISMAGRAFSPSTLTITVGDTVTWTNDDDTSHTVSASGREFDSGDLAEGATFSFTFESAGEFSYFCAYHPEMTGTIIVEA